MKYHTVTSQKSYKKVSDGTCYSCDWIFTLILAYKEGINYNYCWLSELLFWVNIRAINLQITWTKLKSCTKIQSRYKNNFFKFGVETNSQYYLIIF